eukprot:7094947-Prymnesium_polylepis.1
MAFEAFVPRLVRWPVQLEARFTAKVGWHEVLLLTLATPPELIILLANRHSATAPAAFRISLLFRLR